MTHQPRGKLSEKYAKDAEMVKKLESILADVSTVKAKEKGKEEDTKEELGFEERELVIRGSITTIAARASWGVRIVEERKSEVAMKGRAA